MIFNSASPTSIPTVEEQLRSLYQRRSVTARLIHLLEIYQRVTPNRVYPKKSRVA